MKPIQCRMARAALQWTTSELGKKAGIGDEAVDTFERGLDNDPSTVDKLRVALESAGVIFLDENDEGPGVRMRREKPAISDTAAIPGTPRGGGYDGSPM